MAMTSLQPGVLFSGTGLIKTSTPVGAGATPDEIKSRFARGKYSEDTDWPTDSPLAGSYDVSRTSTKLILLNNSMPKSRSRLRGHGASSPDRAPPPDPDRHSTVETQKNPEHHKTCTDSRSPRFRPHPKRPMAWTNQGQRPPWKPSDDSAVERRKRNSLSPRPKSAPISYQDNYYLKHPELGKGDKNYLWNVAKVYSSSNMKVLKHVQYKELLLRQELLGFHSFDEYQKYRKYIDGFRKLTFGSAETSYVSSSSGSRPATSASSRRSPSPQNSSRRERSAKGQRVQTAKRRDHEQRIKSPHGTRSDNIRTGKSNRDSSVSDDSRSEFPRGLESKERLRTAKGGRRKHATESGQEIQVNGSESTDPHGKNDDSKESNSVYKKEREKSVKEERVKSPKERRVKSARDGERSKTPNRSRPGTCKSRKEELLLPVYSPYMEDLTKSTVDDWRIPPPSARNNKEKPSKPRKEKTSGSQEDENERTKKSGHKRPNSTAAADGERSGDNRDETHSKLEDKQEETKHKDESKKKKKTYSSTEGTLRPKSRLGNRPPKDENKKDSESKDKGEEKEHDDTEKKTSKGEEIQLEKQTSEDREDNIEESTPEKHHHRKKKKSHKKKKESEHPVDGDKDHSKVDDQDTKECHNTEQTSKMHTDHLESDLEARKSPENTTQETVTSDKNASDTDNTVIERTTTETVENTSPENESEEITESNINIDGDRSSKNDDKLKADVSSIEKVENEVYENDEDVSKKEVTHHEQRSKEGTTTVTTTTVTTTTTEEYVTEETISRKPTSGKNNVEDKVENSETKTKTTTVETSNKMDEDKHSDVQKSEPETMSIQSVKDYYGKTGPKSRLYASIDVFEGSERFQNNATLTGFIAQIRTYQDAKDILNEMKADLSDNESVSVKIPYACRYPTGNTISEHFDSDGVHGAGLELLHLLIDENVRDSAIYVVAKKEKDGEKEAMFEVPDVLQSARDMFSLAGPRSDTPK